MRWAAERSEGENKHAATLNYGGEPMRTFIIAVIGILFFQVLSSAETFPQLEPLVTKYTQDRKSIDETRARQTEALRARYIAALSTAREEALKASSPLFS